VLARPFRQGRLELDSVESALAMGFPVYTTNLQLIERRSPVRRGIFWVLEPRKDDNPAVWATAAAVSLCSLLKDLPFDPPRVQHVYGLPTSVCYKQSTRLSGGWKRPPEAEAQN
jgi:hypothetical protein